MTTSASNPMRRLRDSASLIKGKEMARDHISVR